MEKNRKNESFFLYFSQSFLFICHFQLRSDFHCGVATKCAIKSISCHTIRLKNFNFRPQNERGFDDDIFGQSCALTQPNNAQLIELCSFLAFQLKASSSLRLIFVVSTNGQFSTASLATFNNGQLHKNLIDLTVNYSQSKTQLMNIRKFE